MDCDHMMCRMKHDIDEDPMYWIGAAFFSGILFSTWSWGIVYLLVFLLLTEMICYIYYREYKKPYDIQIRIGMLFGAIMGFLIGRAITENDDHKGSINEFWDNANYYCRPKYHCK